MGIDEVNIWVDVSYDPKKEEFFVSDINAVVTDEKGRPMGTDKPSSKPGLRPRRPKGSKKGKG